MAEIFAFDDLENTPEVVVVDERKPSGLSKLLQQQQEKDLDGFDSENERLDSVPDMISKSVSIPVNIVSGAGSDHDASLLSTTPGRLGSSYEVGIDQPYVSSFANDNVAEKPNGAVSPRKMTPLDFEPLKVLGEGAYGKVFLVRHKSTGRLFAQKQLKKASMIVEKRKIEQTKTEKTILESVRHPYIVRLFYALQDSEKLYLILEYAQGGELFTHLAMERMFSEDVASFYVAEMVLALCHLHQNVGVVYRDLKPENCLLDADGHLVLTDFGLSKVATEDERCRTFLGTPVFMAPEVLEGKDYDYAVDWWSLGAVTYDLLTGSPPFPGNNHQKIIEKIKKTKLKLPYYLSADAKDFLTRLLRKDPSKRLGYKDINKIKQHRFFRKIDWDKLEKRSSDVEPPIVPVITNPELAENFSDSFTTRELTPEDVESIPIPQQDSDNHPFKGFSFTASTSYIELSMGTQH
ncbi:serine/threonine-protein kinase Ypk3p [Trichomonascus vanleenenianus]|uniref:putative protein kinase YPK3 n=1 Tax=Trichomonascus vanleenenianus TaxID=2268995 RepID=UPI003ECB959D